MTWMYAFRSAREMTRQRVQGDLHTLELVVLDNEGIAHQGHGRNPEALGTDVDGD